MLQTVKSVRMWFVLSVHWAVQNVFLIKFFFKLKSWCFALALLVCVFCTFRASFRVGLWNSSQERHYTAFSIFPNLHDSAHHLIIRLLVRRSRCVKKKAKHRTDWDPNYRFNTTPPLVLLVFLYKQNIPPVAQNKHLTCICIFDLLTVYLSITIHHVLKMCLTQFNFPLKIHQSRSFVKTTP